MRGRHPASWKSLLLFLPCLILSHRPSAARFSSSDGTSTRSRALGIVTRKHKSRRGIGSSGSSRRLVESCAHGAPEHFLHYTSISPHFFLPGVTAENIKDISFSRNLRQFPPRLRPSASESRVGARTCVTGVLAAEAKEFGPRLQIRRVIFKSTRRAERLPLLLSPFTVQSQWPWRN